MNRAHSIQQIRERNTLWDIIAIKATHRRTRWTEALKRSRDWEEHP